MVASEAVIVSSAVPADTCTVASVTYAVPPLAEGAAEPQPDMVSYTAPSVVYDAAPPAPVRFISALALVLGVIGMSHVPRHLWGAFTFECGWLARADRQHVRPRTVFMY